MIIEMSRPGFMDGRATWAVHRAQEAMPAFLLCCHALETRNLGTRGPQFSLVAGHANYGGSPAKDEGTGSDVAHGGVVQGRKELM